MIDPFEPPYPRNIRRDPSRRVRFGVAGVLLALALGPAPSAGREARDAPPGHAGSVVPPRRTVAVTLVTDRAFREWPQWRGYGKRILAEGTAGWDTLAGMSFRIVEEIDWPGVSDSLTLPETLDRMIEDVRPRGEILLGIVGIAPRPRHSNELVGYALLGQPYLIVEHAPPGAMALTLRHELGHVFGLPHLPERSVMADRMEYRTTEFGVLSRDLLRATAAIRFDRELPFLGCDLDVIRDVYFAWAERGTGRAVLLTDLAVAFNRENRPAEALPCLERAIELGASWAPAWYHLGEARLRAGDRVAAAHAFEQYLLLDPAGDHGDATRRQLRELQ